MQGWCSLNKEKYKQRLIQQLLNEDLTLALKGIWLKYRRSTIHSRVPKSNESFVYTSSDQFGQRTDSTQQFLHASSIRRLLFAHKLNVYLTSVQETQLRLYDELERVLREFLSAVRILSKGYLPASLFPPTILHRIISNALQMVQRKNPDYVLMIKHVTEYYDMKMVTFGVNDCPRPYQRVHDPI